MKFIRIWILNPLKRSGGQPGIGGGRSVFRRITLEELSTHFCFRLEAAGVPSVWMFLAFGNLFCTESLVRCCSANQSVGNFCQK